MKERLGVSVEVERQRHKRGLVTFEMLWLVLKPGIDTIMTRTIMAILTPTSSNLSAVECSMGSQGPYSLRYGMWTIPSMGTSTDIDHVIADPKPTATAKMRPPEPKPLPAYEPMHIKQPFRSGIHNLPSHVNIESP